MKNLVYKMHNICLTERISAKSISYLPWRLQNFSGFFAWL